jgi:hypothetical protein
MNTSKKIFLIAFSFISYSVAAQHSEGFNYGKNLFSFSPVQLSERTPTGVGVQYERFIGSSNKFSLYFPFAYSFGHSDPCDPNIRARVFYAYPGVKFYPAGYQHKVTYAVGPSLALGKGTSNCNCDDIEALISDTKPNAYRPVMQMGVIINNSVNIQATEHLYFGSELGIGASYLNTLGGKNIGNDLMVQLNVKVGWRM